MAETSYANCGDLSLAYQVFGDGPVELIFVGSTVSHVELFWTMPEFKAFFEQLATFCRVLAFDKAGVGLSDPIPQVRTLDDRAAEIEAVMEVTTDLTQQFGGTVVKSTGDGHLTTFDGPTQAIRCAEALRADADTLGIQVRAGIHTGECELLDADRRHCSTYRGADPRPRGCRRHPCLARRARPGGRLGYGVRGPRQRRAARRARHLATFGGRSPRPAGGIA